MNLTNLILAIGIALWVLAGYIILHVNDRPVHIHRTYPQMIG